LAISNCYRGLSLARILSYGQRDINKNTAGFFQKELLKNRIRRAQRQKAGLLFACQA
jgi:hypothetical protein